MSLLLLFSGAGITGPVVTFAAARVRHVLGTVATRHTRGTVAVRAMRFEG